MINSPHEDAQEFIAAHPEVPVIEVPRPNSVLPSPSAPFPVEVEPPPTSLPCSWNRCLSGHTWPVTLAVAPCPGCKASMIAVQKTACPFCNEPIVATSLRSDFLVRGAGVSSRCTGAHMPGESLDIELARTQWSEAEATYQPFLVREAAEKAERKL